MSGSSESAGPRAPAAADGPRNEALLRDLRAIVGDRRTFASRGRLLAYECDALTHFKQLPAAVVLPESTEEVQAVVRACVRHRVPFCPRGAGTGLSGGATAPPEGVLIEMVRMNRILRVDATNHLAVVQPGVVNQHLSDAVKKHGLYYAPDPSSQTVCSIGGNVAENAGGPHCLKYGSTERHVLAVKVVLPNGEVADLGGPNAFAHGLDLRGLFVGSEGTLGIAT